MGGSESRLFREQQPADRPALLTAPEGYVACHVGVLLCDGLQGVEDALGVVVAQPAFTQGLWLQAGVVSVKQDVGDSGVLKQVEVRGSDEDVEAILMSAFDIDVELTKQRLGAQVAGDLDERPDLSSSQGTRRAEDGAQDEREQQEGAHEPKSSSPEGPRTAEPESKRGLGP